MSEIFFTSDTHFGHRPEFLWKPRGFSSVEEMDEAIIENWNKVVKQGDVVYHLGDTMLNDNTHGLECFKRLNGQIFLIYGNHDSDARKNLLFTELPGKMLGGWYAWLIKYGKHSIYLSHYPTLTANFDSGKHFNQNVINLHGHIHSKNNWMIPTNPFIYHVGVDSHNCTPVHIDEILSDIRQRWNEIEKLPQNLKPEDTYPYGGII